MADTSTTRPRRAQGHDLATRMRVSHQVLRRRLEGRDTLIDLLRAVATPLDPAGIAAQIVERLPTWLPVPCWAVVAVDRTGELSILAVRGVQPEAAPAVYAVAGWVVQRGKEFVTASLRRDQRIPAQIAVSVVAFPLSCQGRRVGVVVGLDRDPSERRPRLMPAIQRAMGILLEPAATALDNALRLQHTEALSVTDDLTQLYNSRFLNSALRREAKRSVRSGRQLSLVFVDLDGFKLVNDRHGHLFGSRALMEAGSAIRGSARETDVVARYGGDEFAVVLPDTDTQGAFALGERIRQRIAAHRFLLGEGRDVRLTASVGVATLPDVAASVDELVRAADGAMYEAKSMGKNGIRVAASLPSIRDRATAALTESQ